MAEALGGDTAQASAQPPFEENLQAGGPGSDEENMNNVRHLLVERMDPDFGLIDKLLEFSALTYPETVRIKGKESIFDRNDKLLELIFNRMKHQALLTALTDTGQEHLSNLVKGNGGYRSEYGTVWPLRERETQILDANRFNLVDIIDLCDLITRMFSKSVISNRQQRYINGLPNNTEKAEVLLDILRRGSEEYYWKTVLCLQESNQSDIAEILMDGGVLAQVHVSHEGEIEQVNEEEDHMLETLVNFFQDTTLPQYQRIRERLDLRIMRAKKGHSIIFYIYCKTLEELLYLYELLTKGGFKKCISTVFDMLISKRETTVSVVNWSAKEFTRFKTYFEGPPKQREAVEGRSDEDVGSQKKSLEAEVTASVGSHLSSVRMEYSGDFREFLGLLLRRRVPMGYMLAGSVAELPVQYVLANLTDFDHMNFSLTLCAVSPTDPFPEKFHGDVLLVETNDDYPGFARLKYCDNSGVYFKRWQLLHSSSPGPAHKGTFMSFNELNNLLSEDEKRRFQPHLQHYETTPVDLVNCVVCPFWPKAAVEWIRRQRNNEWPTKELLSKVVHGGCHFVAKAHPKFPYDETLFRFSFSAAEIVLVNSWSAVQKYIYHILRLIKTSVEKQCKEKRLESAIFSYTMKTLMLWACESKHPYFWNKSSITISVIELVSELIEWLIEGRCQNYFIPSNNMFEHPKGDVDLTIQILSSFVCNEFEIKEITAKWSVPNPDVYFPYALSDKLSLLAQFAVTRVSHFVNPIEPNSDNSVCLDQLVADGSEFHHLVSGLLAHFQAVKNKREHQTDSIGNYLMRTALFHLDQSMRATPQTTSHIFVYFGRSVYENLPYLVGRKQPDLHRTCIYTQDEETIVQLAVKAQKINRELAPSGLDVATAIAINFCIQGVDKSIPKASYFASAAYRANFYFTYLEQYGECLRICKEAEERFSALQKRIGICDYCDDFCTVVLTRKWSVIFDQCIQTVFGLILLHDHCFSRQEPETRKSVQESKSSFVIYISPMTFIRYVGNQCRLRLSRLLTAQDLVDQYLECSRLLLESVYNDQEVRLTTESQKHFEDFK